MFFIVLLSIAAAVAVALFMSAARLRPKEDERIAAFKKAKPNYSEYWDKHHLYNAADSRSISGAAVGVVVFALALTCAISTGINYSTHLEARKMALLLPQKEQQREALVGLVRAELSNDQYAQLTGIVDANAFVVFARGTAVGDFLIARSAQIVGLNADIYRLRNELDAKRIDLCNRLDNPFVPRLPFIGPDCAINTHTPA